MAKDKKGQDLQPKDDVIVYGKVVMTGGGNDRITVDIGGHHASILSTHVEKVSQPKQESVSEAALRGFNDQGGK